MSNWYSNIVGATTSKISSLQRSLLNSEADGDTEDDTHVCRVLRSYYAEKGTPLPGWLPPDPKAPPPVAPVYAQSQVGARYGGLPSQQPQGGLSSLWDNNAAPQQQDVQSLRRGRGGPPMRANDPRNSPFRGSDPMTAPLPSQRAGAYQSSQPYGSSATPPAGQAGGSAQDRLRQKLWGGGGARTTSPGGSGPFPPPSGGNPRGGPGDYGGYSGGGAPQRRPVGGGGGLPSGPRMR